MFLAVLVVVGLPELYAYAWIDENFARLQMETELLESVGGAVFDGMAAIWLSAVALRALSGRAAPLSAGAALRLWLILLPVAAVGNFAWNTSFGQNSTWRFGVGVVASIMISVGLWVYAPVVVAERRGLWASLRRSLALASGNGWRITMLVLLYLLSYLLLAAVAWSLSPVGFSTHLTLDYGGSISIGAVLNVLLNQLVTVLSVASYVLLRNDKDGVPVEEIAPVFD